MLKVKNLCKTYPEFQLKNVSFEIPAGYIVGFLGTNGAGKTTTIKSILNIVLPDSGKVVFFDKNIKTHETQIKQNIGFILGAFDCFPKTKIKDITKTYASFFPSWNNEKYKNYLTHFNISENKKISELSAGMRVKYGLTLALCHGAKLLLLDEPTSGLDPLAREDLLDLFREIVEDGETSILFSTHITSDLDKCADYILLIKQGEILLNETRDLLIDSHLKISGKKSDLTTELKEKVVAHKSNDFGFTALIKRDLLTSKDKVLCETPNLEDIMIYYNMEGKNAKK